MRHACGGVCGTAQGTCATAHATALLQALAHYLLNILFVNLLSPLFVLFQHTHTHTHTHTYTQGGLDNYIVNTREDKLDSELGLQLKEQVYFVRSQLPFTFRVILAVCLGVSSALRSVLAYVRTSCTFWHSANFRRVRLSFPRLFAS